MQGRVAPNMRVPRYIYWETLFDYGSPVSVSTLTSLLSFTDMGSDFAEICVFLYNDDATESVDLTVELSHGGTNPVDSATQVKRISAKKEDFVQVSYPNPFTYLRISASALGPSFPTVNVKWAVLGLRR